MSLYKKLALLFIATATILMMSALGIVYTQSRALIESQAKQKTVLLIQTINSALEAGIPDFNFETILLHLRQQNPNIRSFDIYKLNGYFYDIASTNPKNIGKHAPVALQHTLQHGVTTTTMHNNMLHIISPILIDGNTLYSTDVQYSMATDLSSIGVLLSHFLEIGAATALLMIILLWAFIHRLLSRPLISITAAANDIAGGNFQVDLAELERRKDEIGMLARSFSHMVEQLTEMLRRISITADELNTTFQTLVAGGDRAARGALHVSDVMGRVEHELKEQKTLTETMARLTVELGEMDVLLPPLHELGATSQAISRKIGDLSEELSSVASTTNGQLTWIHEANRSITKLRELASELQELTSVFD